MRPSSVFFFADDAAFGIEMVQAIDAAHAKVIARNCIRLKDSRLRDLRNARKVETFWRRLLLLH